MKTLAIDYGTRKIGLAVSNKGGTIAFPFGVINNNAELIKTLKQIIKQEEIKKIIVGLPEYNRKTNFYYQTEKFVNNLKSTFDIPIAIQDELLTSEAAKRLKGTQSKSRHDMAAMLILQEYLSK
jgi:putative Holliday junction resolvase